ncbi:MAG: class I SAM-dependent methyltransferase [Gammaproteobacteria bacterium]|jgi:predicted methyltransferase|nr:class I SAM-dependent methyltransferase [Gammaproteobacteria bacterium]MBT4491651.1 class I SAM-dependent methyltransferase [Gammaproteobacteria bacterium]MBT7369709.1 class I SAM-dependent methyltransferase [Gammaproteobacteria bacterium]
MKYLILIGLCLPLFSLAENSPTEEKINAALEHERRNEKDHARDDNRSPIETLKFFRFEDNQTVLELLPGGGWYTKILGPVLEEKGKLYVSIGTNTVEKMIVDQPGFSTTEVIPFDGITRSETEQPRYTMPEFSFGVRKLDLVLTFRNMHNFDAVGRANLNRASFDTLKKGGLYGVVDHTRRHMQPDTREVWRRMDPLQIIKEVESAGFRFVDYADLHYRPDDELRYEVGRKTVTGNTDRFTLLFEKP